MIENIILLSVSALIIFIFHKLILKPYLGILYYRKQGMPMKFYPLSTGILKYEQDAAEKGDYFCEGREIIEKNPKIKGFGFNTVYYPHIFLNDVDAIKDFICNLKDYEKSDNLFYLFRLWASEGVFFTNGPVWKRHRKAISTIFHY